METLVYDTAAIFNFGHRDDLTFLLEKLSKAHTLLTTPDVVAEIADPARAAYYKKLLADWFEIKPVSAIPFDTATLAALSATLDPGEISVLMLAKALQATAVLDEKAARREAQSLAVKFTGTLGILQLAVKRKWMKDSECLSRVRQLCDRGFRIPRPAPHHTFAEYISAIE
jgi:predicted nucleic acid-binding protein